MFEKILVTLDGSELAEEVIPYVEDIAKRCNAEIILMRVSPPAHTVVAEGVVVSPLDEQLDQIEADFKRYLDRVADVLRARGLTVQTVIRFGNPAEEIVDFSENNDVKLIAIATHGRSGLSRWVYGSVAEKVLRAASAPILLIRSAGATHE